MRASTIDGTAFCAMLGIGEANLSLFVLAAGLGQVLSGMVMTVPMLLGATLQLGSLWGARRVGGFRNWTALTAAVQALAWIPLGVMALIGVVPAWAVLASVILYQAAGQAAGATWTTWIGQMIPPHLRSRFFGRRARMLQLGNVAGLVVGGLILHAMVGERAMTEASQSRSVAQGIGWFAVLFGIAFLLRAVSAYYLYRQTDTGPVTDDHIHVHPIDFLRRVFTRPEGRLIATMVLMTLAVNIANPFFAAFMKDEVHLSYAQIMVISVAHILTKALVQKRCAEIGREYGAWTLLVFGGVLLVPISGLWLLMGSFWGLLGAQILAGVAWAAWELATLLLLLEVLPEHERTSLWSMFSLTNALMAVAGSTLGGLLLAGKGLPAGWMTWIAERGTAFQAAFVLSVLARLGVLLWIARSHRHMTAPGRER